MIPFGCGNAIVSLVSHDKLRYFLESIGHPEWGVEVLAADFVDKVKTQISAFKSCPTHVLDQVGAAQQHMWTITQENFATIDQSLRQGLVG